MATSKNRLGRGLGSLIAGGGPQSSSKQGDSKQAQPSKAAPAPNPLEPMSATDPASPYREISVSRIEPNPYQPRRAINPERVKELAESIRSEGLLQPIVVRSHGERFQLIAGERRWQAHQQLGLKYIPARVMEASDSSSAVIALIENLQREGLDPIEESLGYASLMRDFDLTQEAVAERLGKARASIANALRLLQLDREIQGYLSKGLLSVGHAKVLLGLGDPAERSLLARKILESGLSVRETERYLKQWKNESTSRLSRSALATEMTAIQDLQKRLSVQLNTKVELKHGPKRGRIIIEYQGNEDLQRILEKTGMGSGEGSA